MVEKELQSSEDHVIITSTKEEESIVGQIVKFREWTTDEVVKLKVAYVEDSAEFGACVTGFELETGSKFLPSKMRTIPLSRLVQKKGGKK